ncbi:hypothetical protein FOT98_18310 [Bacillus sp. HY001]|uniref:hypothetical protein n=1 Tax=Bacillus TaxID=1386 RepID=UPI001185F6A8|nr:MULTISPECIES: hypothetical protein [Bacillus]TSI12477.1 hypothetical protein FOT98_18310 [Bacillus sp. HY001]
MEITTVNGAGGGHGSSPSKKKANKKMLFLAGGAGLVVLIVLMQKSRQPQSVETLQNSIPISDSQRMDNFQSIVTGQMDAMINGAVKDLNSEWGDKFKEVTTGITDALKQRDADMKDYNRQQQDWMRDSISSLKDSLGGGVISAIKNADDPLWTIGSGGKAESNKTYEEGLEVFRKDRGLLKTEMERTNSVIEYRKNNGLQTADQEAHLKRLGDL